MVERAALVAAVVVLVCVAGHIIRTRALRRSEALAGTLLPVQLGSQLSHSAPGIVYFYGPYCSTCRRQAGVLDGLADVDGISIVRIDASRETHLVDELGVMTVPATVVVDRLRRVRSVNLGFRSADSLRVQLRSVSTE